MSDGWPGWALPRNDAHENGMENMKGAKAQAEGEGNYVYKNLNENSDAKSGTVLNLILLSGILDTNRLSGPNYVNWLQNLKIILDAEQIGYVIDTTRTVPLPEEPDALKRRQDDELKARSYILASMTNELQCRYEKIDDVATIMARLQHLYGEQSRTAKYRMSKELFQMKMTEGTDLTEHVIKMMNLIHQLKSLNFVMDNALQTDLILKSLPNSFAAFIGNFYMNIMECPLEELLNRLLAYQRQIVDMRKETLVVDTSKETLVADTSKETLVADTSKETLVADTSKETLVADTSGLPRGTRPDKKKKKKKGKGAAQTDRCFHCNVEGHWKRNCSYYLASLKVKKDLSFKD